ncbi:MAG: cysteine methyltransferase [Nanoarchaeota archaeon]|nr:cysteine methyltransferase [Nanoarchaeota archaeon]|tara:strand:- start:386 stop:700 length:315 start_codon:yes stop_codon:yes gene_type:complete
MNFFNKVYGLCKEIPRGKISTYGDIAKKLNSKAYRLVGQALKNNPYAPKVPCHRVVDSKGFLHGFSGSKSQKNLNKKAKLLKEEGVNVKDNKIVDFDKCLYKFK